MRKSGKLYTVNKWNMPAFMPKKNMFGYAGPIDTSGGLGSLYANNASELFGSRPLLDAKTEQLVKSQSNNAAMTNTLLGKGKTAGGGLGSLVGSIGGIGAGMVGKMVGSGIAGNLAGTSTAGKVFSGIGDIVNATPLGSTPIGMAVSFGTQVLGGVADGLLGSKRNEENIAAANKNMSNISGVGNSTAGAGTNEEVLKNWDVNLGYGFSKGFLGEEGAWNNDITNLNKSMQRQLAEAKLNALQGQLTGVKNANTNQANDVLYHSAEFGGPIETMDNE